MRRFPIDRLSLRTSVPPDILLDAGGHETHPPSARQFDSSHLGYRPDIDGLRAVAVLAVVGFHAFPDWLKGGFVGVDVFFVISGFLISRIIFTSLEGPGFSYAGFYARRARRIFPALISVLLACFACGWLFLPAFEYKQLGKHMAAGTAFVSNFVSWNEAGYFDFAAEVKPLLHLWSLGIEEQFYIFWPLLLGWAWRSRWNFLALTAGIAVASFLLNLHLAGTNSVAAFYSPLARFWELMAGGLLAYVSLHKPERLTWRPNFVSAAGLLLVVLGILLIDRQKAFPGWWALLPVLGAVLIITAGPAAWCNRRLLTAKPLVWIGLISYPLYLWHWPVLVFSRRLARVAESVEAQLLAVALSFALAWLTYKLIEMPVREGKKTLAGMLSLGALMATLCLVGVIVYQRDGFSFRPVQQGWLDAERSPEESYTATTCRRRLGLAVHFCMLESDDPAPSVALVGDSFANALYFGLRDYYLKRNEILFQVGNGSCPPLFDITSNYKYEDGSQCAKAANAYLRKIAEDKRITTVILAGNWHLYLNGRRFNPRQQRNQEWKLGLPDRPSSTSNEAIFAEAFEHTVKYLMSANKHIIFVHQTPELDYELSDCVSHPQMPEEKCKSDRRKVQGYLAEYRRMLDPLLKKYPSIVVLDPLEIFCDARFCYSKRDDIVLYRDDLHLSKAGSIYLGQRISLP